MTDGLILGEKLKGLEMSKPIWASDQISVLSLNTDLEPSFSSADNKPKIDPEPDKNWSEYTKAEKYSYVVWSFVKVVIFVIFLYFFLVSLNFMTIGFSLVSGVALEGGNAIKFILHNPFAALAIGIIVTAIMQNATATTSIAVSMVGAGIIPSVSNAIPIIMGSNIGTCFTNSLIALTLADDPNEFKRAFSAATLNDMFNFLTTAVLLPIEIFTNFLLVVSDKLTDLIPFDHAEQIAQANFISAILDPFTNLFIRVNTSALDALINGDTNVTEIALRCCSQRFIINETVFENYTLILNQTVCLQPCTYWCMPMLRVFGDAGTGLFWIIISILVLIACLFGIVKVLSLLIVGPIAKGVRKGLNANIPGKMKWFTQVILFIVALLLTLIVQSSNIITATLVPLCGIGLISLQRVYVMTLGSNIGTTVTGILSAFTLSPTSMRKGLQLGFVYTLFNTLGVVFWLPISKLRFPKKLSRKLGNIVFRYRWFLYVYIFSVYFIMPIIVFCLALAPYWIGLAIVGIPLILLVLSFLVLMILQKHFSRVLPKKLLDMSWMPEWLVSLEYYDKKIHQCTCCCLKRQRVQPKDITPKIDFIVVSKAQSGTQASVCLEQVNQVDACSNLVLPMTVRRLSALSGLIKDAEYEIKKLKRDSIWTNPYSSSSDDENDQHESDPIDESKKIKTYPESFCMEP